MREIVIAHWMIDNLNLKRCDLLTYATIFTASGYVNCDGFYRPTISDLEWATGYSRSQIYKTIKKLEKIKLIKRVKDNNGKIRFETTLEMPMYEIK